MVQWEAELTELVTRRGGALVGYAYSLTRDKPQAEDLVQDALVKVYSRLRRPGGNRLDLTDSGVRGAEGYVRRAILTLYLDGYRRRNHWAGLRHLLADDDRSPGADRVATARVDVGTALRRLSPRQREVVTLRYFEDLTVPQIARVLGTSQGTVKRHLFDATAVLREALADVVAPDTDTTLDERLDAVTGAVRRRRTAKVAATAGASLVLMALLAFAAVWGPGRFLSEPVPPATPSPDASAVAAGPGWTPDGWRQQGPQFRCGMEVTELVSSSDQVLVEITEPPTATTSAQGHGLQAAVRVTRTDGPDGPVLDGGYPVLVFARDGQVVDLGRGWPEGGYRLPGGGESADELATAGPATACGDWTTNPALPAVQYLDERPEGRYDVYAALWYGTGDGDTSLAVSEPVTADVPALEVPDEPPLTIGIRDGYQPPWLAGTGLACGAHASAIPGDAHRFTTRTGLEAEVDPAPAQVTLRFRETRGEPFEVARTPFTLVWLSAGRVVAVGTDVWSQPRETLRVEADGVTSYRVPVGEPDTTCLTEPGAVLPPGDYDIFALAGLDPDGDAGHLSVNTSGQVNFP